MVNTLAADRADPVLVVLPLVAAAEETKTDFFGPVRTTSLARIVPRVVLEENQVQGRAARREVIMGMNMIALPVAVVPVPVSAVAVGEDNRTIFKRNHRKPFSGVFLPLFFCHY